MFRYFAFLLLAMAGPANAATFSISGTFTKYEYPFGVFSGVFVPFTVEVELTPTAPFSPFFNGQTYSTRGNCALSSDICNGQLNLVTRPDGSLLLYDFLQVGPNEQSGSTVAGQGFFARALVGSRGSYVSFNPVFMFNGTTPVSSAPDIGLWAMLVVGFGVIGHLFRRRARSAIAARAA